MSFGLIAGVVALAAAGGSAYVKGQSAKGMAKRVKSLREEQAARADRAGQDLDLRTRKTSDEFKPEERTALTEKNDQANRDTLTRIHDDLEGKKEEGSDQKFKGKISQGFKDKLAAERGTTKERSSALREAQAQFNSPVQAGQEEANLLQNLGIDNNTIKSFMRGDQRSIDAKIAGLKPGGQGLAQFLDTLALVAGAASLGAGSFGGASSGASAVNPGQLALDSGGTITNIGQAGNSASNIGSFAGNVGNGVSNIPGPFGGLGSDFLKTLGLVPLFSK